MPNLDPLTYRPSSGGNTDPAQDPGKLSANAGKVIGFSLAGLALVGFSRVAPSASVAVTALIVLAVVITQNEQVTALINGYVNAIGGNS